MTQEESQKRWASAFTPSAIGSRAAEVRGTRTSTPAHRGVTHECYARIRLLGHYLSTKCCRLEHGARPYGAPAVYYGPSADNTLSAFTPRSSGTQIAFAFHSASCRNRHRWGCPPDAKPTPSLGQLKIGINHNAVDTIVAGTTERSRRQGREAPSVAREAFTSDLPSPKVT